MVHEASSLRPADRSDRSDCGGVPLALPGREMQHGLLVEEPDLRIGIPPDDAVEHRPGYGDGVSTPAAAKRSWSFARTSSVS